MNFFLLFILALFFLSPHHVSAKEVSLQEKIDQMIIVGFRGSSYERAPDIQKILQETNIGGVILFDYDTPTKKYNRNIFSQTQLKKLITDLQKNAQTPPFISIDEEGGRVSRLKSMKGYAATPTANVLGSYTTARVSRIGASLGKRLSSLGITMNFAPVLDIDTGKQNPIIGKFGRAFGVTPEKVSLYGTLFAGGLEKGGVMAIGKHFPGHGSALSDSHKEFTDITSVWTEAELIPFRQACKEGITGIMVGHLVDKRVDKQYPATLSKAHIQKLKDIGCADQLIVTDDMDMRAITSHYEKIEAAILAVKAGVDVLIYSNNIDSYAPADIFIIRKALYDAVISREIPQSRIDESYQKIMKIKGIL